MDTVDNLLKTIVVKHEDLLNDSLSPRDSKVLKNLAKLINDSKYITENQANLAVKILRENSNKLLEFKNEIENTVSSPVWARAFRVIQHHRKIYIDTSLEYPQIAIETTFSADLQRVLVQLSKGVEGFCNVSSGKTYHAALTEKNIVEVIDKLKGFKFSVSDDLKEYYKTIKSWSKDDIEAQYQLTTIAHPNFEKQIVADLGIDTAIGQPIIRDRSIRYQYVVKNPEKLPENLTNYIATRDTAKVWVDKNTTSLDEIVRSLLELKRLPILFVLDSRDETKCLDDLQNLSISLEKNGVIDSIGVYFRLDNSAAGKEFNQFIANKKYNGQLDDSTKVVVVQSGKVPKFLLKTDWKPMSVVSINHSLRHSKTAVYSACCDLIVTYTNDKPMIEARHPWE